MRHKYLLLSSFLGILVLAGFGCIPVEPQDDAATPAAGVDADDAMEGDAMMERDGDAMEGDAMMEKDGDAMEAGDSMEQSDEPVTAAQAGSYEAYDASKLSRAEDGSVVIFFHAAWCPSCRGLESDIQANRGNIPDGVTILKADYDTERDLKKKYGVTYQHTLVQVDADGNLIKKWSGGGTLDSLIGQIQS